MNPILYYIPGDRAALTPEAYSEVIKEFHLEHLRGTHVQSRRIEQNGPNDGGCGLVFSPYLTETPNKIGYWPNDQTWSRCGGYWLGVFKDKPVEPESLRRKDTPIQRTWTVTLADEQQWDVPLARWPYPCETIGESLLPHRRCLDANGNEVKRVAEQYVKLDAEAHWFYEQYLRIGDGEVDEIDLDRVVDVAACAVEVLYHVSRKEIMLLGLLTDEAARAVCEATTGITAVQRMQKALETAQKKTDGT